MRILPSEQKLLRVALIDKFKSESWYSSQLAKELYKELYLHRGILYLYGSKKCNYKLDTIPTFKTLWTPGLYPLQLVKNCIKDKIKIIHLQFEFVTFEYGSIFIIPFLFILRLCGLKIVVTLHGPFFPKNMSNDLLKTLRPSGSVIPIRLLKAYIIFTYLLISKVSHSIIVHHNVFRKWLKAWGVSNCKVIPHGVINNKSCIGLGNRNYWRLLQNYNLVVLFFGVLSPRKGIEYLIEAFSYVSEKIPNSILVIAGEAPSYYRGYKKKLRNMVYALGIANKVMFTGYVGDELVHELFQRADIVVLPYSYSISASGPLSLAIGYGKPIIATATECFSEILEHGIDALLVLPKNVEALTNAILTLERDYQLRQKLSKNIKFKAEAFSWKKVAEMTFEIYNRILKNR